MLVCSFQSQLNQPQNIPIWQTLIQYGSLKRMCYFSERFHSTIFFSLKFDPTLSSHNSGLKNYCNKNHHIFRKPIGRIASNLKKNEKVAAVGM